MKATNQQLLSDLRQRLAARVNLTVSDKYYDLYEAYLFALVVEAARVVAPACVSFESGAGVPVRMLFCGTSPGRMDGASARRYTHAVVALGGDPGRDLEIHLGVYFAGTQRVPHECDIAVVLRPEGLRARGNGVYPRASQLKLAFEAKYREANLRLAVGREFLGLRSQLKRDCCISVTNSEGPKTARMLSKGAAFVTRSPRQPSTTKSCSISSAPLSEPTSRAPNTRCDEQKEVAVPLVRDGAEGVSTLAGASSSSPKVSRFPVSGSPSARCTKTGRSKTRAVGHAAICR